MNAITVILSGFAAELVLTYTVLFLLPQTSHYEQIRKVWYRICFMNEDDSSKVRKKRVRSMMIFFAAAALLLFFDLTRRYPAIDDSLKSSGVDSGFLVLGLVFGWMIPFVIWLQKEKI